MKIQIEIEIETPIPEDVLQKMVSDVLHKLATKIQDNEILIQEYKGTYLEDSEGNEIGFMRII